MRLDVSQQLRLQQEMRLSPRIIQAMEILQLPMLALQERIDAELISNPVLELQSPDPDESPSEPVENETVDPSEKPLVVEERGDQSDDFDRLSKFTEEYGMDFINSEPASRPRAPVSGEGDRKLDAMANTAAPGQSLNDYLLDQWRFLEMGERTRRLGELIVAHIDEDGYMRTPLEELAEKARLDDKIPQPVSMQDLQVALHLVQTLEPRGVAARDLKECLSIQLTVEAAAGKDVSLEQMLVQRFAHDLEMNRMPQIAKRTGRSLAEIKHAIENLSRLDPRPGSRISSRIVPVIRPEIIVEIDENDQVVVTMADGSMSNLRISAAYKRLARNRKTDKEAKQFIRKNIRSAQWLVSAIAQRRETIRRVAQEVFRVQRDFLDLGEEALKPLPMAVVAKRINVHVATVSRAVSGKYVQTPRGIYPLRMFFTGGTTATDGNDVAWEAVKVKLKEIVDAEDKSNPLNDDQLARELRKHFKKIARRTVAKYRGLLGIPPARRRKEY
ncbi:MAG: RNA polymerase factor sigma-54 [Planctomycetes bacterium]|nr:RNA polymerase factor sigma-54 [Planctomycetota bacterium]